MTEIAPPSKGLHGDAATAASPQGLGDRRELALIALERTRMPMIVTDPRQADNPIVLANQAFLNLCGFTARDVIGSNCRFLQGPQTDPAGVRALDAAIAAGEEASVELLNYRRDGSTFWNQIWISPIHDDAGKLLYFFGSQLDVSERHRVDELERAEHRLMREVDHRAMNVLALVQAITRLTKADDAKQFAQAVRGRVQVLADAHTILAEQGWRPVALSELVDRVIQPGSRQSIVMGGEALQVSATTVQPLAIVLHELMANANAYGAMSSAEGRLRIDWTYDRQVQAICIDWQETGGPSPRAERTAGYGSTMIKAVIERQLGGKAQMDWRGEGLHARLTFPAFKDGQPVLVAEAAA
ncbi:PAS domain-containing protein [Caulobacter sp.]|uniref:blue-light-activated histidine kinase n=1 Tax=Caulobacter sp. TaxID=78 RepID=UPI003BB025E4